MQQTKVSLHRTHLLLFRHQNPPTPRSQLELEQRLARIEGLTWSAPMEFESLVGRQDSDRTD